MLQVEFRVIGMIAPGCELQVEGSKGRSHELTGSSAAPPTATPVESASVRSKMHVYVEIPSALWLLVVVAVAAGVRAAFDRTIRGERQYFLCRKLLSYSEGIRH